MNIIKRTYNSIKDKIEETYDVVCDYFFRLYTYTKCYITNGHQYEYSESYIKTHKVNDDEFFIVRKYRYEVYKCKHCGYTKTILK